MITFADWLPPVTVGLTFTILGSIKLWGLKRGIVGARTNPSLNGCAAPDPPGRAAVCGWAFHFSSLASG